jgi:hypothetical protein
MEIHKTVRLILFSWTLIFIFSIPIFALDEYLVYDHIDFNQYIVLNNIWGKYTFNYQFETNDKQSIFREKDSGGSWNFGWKWEWPFYKGHVKAYPEVIFGYKPGFPHSTTPLLPIKVKDINEITASYDVEIKATGKCNLSFDLWITKSTPPGYPSREIMIWVDNLNWDKMDDNADKIKLMGKVTIEGEDYYFYTANFGWSYLAFIKIDKKRKNNLKLDKFIQYLVKNGYITEDEYLTSIEFGNEIIEGIGETVVKSYSVNMK